MLTDLVEVVNQKSSYNPHLYPIPAVALAASSVLTTASSQDTQVLVKQAEAAGQRRLWTHTAPTNALLLLNGHPTGAIGDVMSVKLDAASPSTGAAESVTLTLDVVHQPKLISELQDHGKQTLDEHSHYHQFTPSGVAVDAAKFLAQLASSPKSASQGECHTHKVWGRGDPAVLWQNAQYCMVGCIHGWSSY